MYHFWLFLFTINPIFMVILPFTDLGEESKIEAKEAAIDVRTIYGIGLIIALLYLSIYSIITLIT